MQHFEKTIKNNKTTVLTKNPNEIYIFYKYSLIVA